MAIDAGSDDVIWWATSGIMGWLPRGKLHVWVMGVQIGTDGALEWWVPVSCIFFLKMPMSHILFMPASHVKFEKIQHFMPISMSAPFHIYLSVMLPVDSILRKEHVAMSNLRVDSHSDGPSAVLLGITCTL